MERGDLVVSTEAASISRNSKIAVLVVCILMSIALWGMALPEDGASGTVQLVVTAIVSVVLLAFSVVNLRTPESYCAVYEHALVGRTVSESVFCSKVEEFELGYDEITEVRRFKKKSDAQKLLICTEKGSYTVFCRVNQQQLIESMVLRINAARENSKQGEQAEA